MREDLEVAASMIPGAIHIPLGQFNTRLAEIDRPVIVVWGSSHRSAGVADALNDAVYTADTIVDGMGAWQQSGMHIC